MAVMMAEWSVEKMVEKMVALMVVHLADSKVEMMVGAIAF